MWRSTSRTTCCWCASIAIPSAGSSSRFAILCSPVFSDQMLYLYLAEQLSLGKNHPDEDEFLSGFRMPFEALVQKVLSGEIDDCKTVAGVLKVWAMRQK